MAPTPFVAPVTSEAPKPAASVVHVATGLLNVLSPLQVPVPETPSAPIASLALLAFTRRELGDTSAKTTAAPASLTTTSQSIGAASSSAKLLAAPASQSTSTMALAGAAPTSPVQGLVCTVSFVVSSVVNVVGGLLGGLFNQVLHRRTDDGHARPRHGLG